jgi:hypothetical protein
MEWYGEGGSLCGIMCRMSKGYGVIVGLSWMFNGSSWLAGNPVHIDLEYGTN